MDEFVIEGSITQCGINLVNGRFTCPGCPLRYIRYRYGCENEHIREAYLCPEHAGKMEMGGILICTPCAAKTGKPYNVHFLTIVEVP